MHEITNAIGNAVSSLSTADLYVISGALATAVIYAINHVKELHKASNVLLSWVLPLSAAGLHSLLSGGSMVAQGTTLYFVSQICYYAVEALLSRKKEVIEPTTPLAQF